MPALSSPQQPSAALQPSLPSKKPLQAHAISDVGGFDFWFLFLKFPDKNKRTDPAKLQELLLSYKERGVGVGMGCSWIEVNSGAGGAFGETTAAQGLIAGHAYTILRTVVPENGGGRLFLRIRNPHGRGEWQGAYSDNWHGWASEAALQEELQVCLRMGIEPNPTDGATHSTHTILGGSIKY